MIIMDTRIREFEKIKIQKYIPELDLLNNPVLNTQEKEFLAEAYFVKKKLRKIVITPY